MSFVGFDLAIYENLHKESSKFLDHKAWYLSVLLLPGTAYLWLSSSNSLAIVRVLSLTDSWYEIYLEEIPFWMSQKRSELSYPPDTRISWFACIIKKENH